MGCTMKTSVFLFGLFAATALAPVAVARSVQPPATVITAGTQKSWSEGQKRVEKGEKHLRKSEELRSIGEKQKVEGNLLVSEGNNMKAQAEGLTIFPASPTR
jgi:hypothetical protein